ncbi:uncharacterized protein LOC116181166 [Photinus pyralis]|uniref:uncharacterized protein LOC116181166 n=1 Tax=Photinus pyralis TaxID=7054 RepID=UPI00126733C1|nr:uncharacterized protein LOC116181166 [Photinus pyralis]
MIWFAVLLALVSISECNSQRPANCPSKKCDGLMQMKDAMVNLPFGCLPSENLRSLWRCMCETRKDQCFADVYNNCSKIVEASGQGCKTCDREVLLASVDSFRAVDNRCCCPVFHGTLNGCLCSVILDDCPGPQFTDCYQQAAAAAIAAQSS